MSNWIANNKNFAWAIIPALAFIEACPGAGLFVSGVILLTVSTVLYAQNILSLTEISLLACLGALMADHLGYYLGIMFGPKLESSRFASSRQKNIRKAKEIILKYGTLSIIMGRLIPAVRSLIPLMVGISHLNKIKFTVIDTLACAIWSTGLYLLAGGIGSVFI